MCIKHSRWPSALCIASLHLVLVAGCSGDGVEEQEVVIDQDGDGFVGDADCDDTRADIGAATTWFLDSDGDGFGDPAVSVESCVVPDGHLAESTDCDDADIDVNPGAQEKCDGRDTDCDGLVDDDDDSLDVATASSWFIDTDMDGFGVGDVEPVVACVAPSGSYAATDDDCDDSNATVNPAAVEACDGVDTDCDSVTDEAGLATFVSADGALTDLTLSLSGSIEEPADFIPTGDGVLSICSGSWFASIEVDSTVDLEIVGLGGVSETVLSGGGAWRPITVDVDGEAATIQIQGLTIRDGYVLNGTGGAALYARNASVSMSDVVITENEAANRSGGGLFLDDSVFWGQDIEVSNNTSGSATGGIIASATDITLMDSIVSSNQGESGGGVTLTDGSVGTFSNSLFVGNSGDTAGGVYVTSGSALVVDGLSTFESNESGGFGGGAIYISEPGSSVELDGTVITGNSSAGAGGGIRLNDQATLVADGVEVSSNVSGGAGFSSGGGGGIACYESSTVRLLDGSVLSNNAAEDNGGAVFSDGCTLELDSVDLSENSAQDGGGGLYLRNSSAATITNSNVLDNTAGYGGGVAVRTQSELAITGVDVSDNNSSGQGGGVNLTGSDFIAENCIIADNRAGSDGGGLFIHNAEIDIDTVVVDGNRSDVDQGPHINHRHRGGGGVLVWSSVGELVDVDVLDNDAASHGGGALLYDSEIEWMGGTFSGNSSVRNGGGILIGDDGDVLLSDMTFTENASGDLGGGMAVRNTTALALVDVLVTQNLASDWGGGLLVSGARVMLDGVSVTQNSSGRNNGGSGIYTMNLSGVDAIIASESSVQGNLQDDLYNANSGTSHSFDGMSSFRCDNLGCGLTP